MALSLGKLTILVGAGIVGSIVAREGRLSDASGFFSSALKIAWNQLKQDDSSISKAKPKNDALLAQVNSLREELQLLSSNRHITIVSSTSSGASRYGMIIIVIFVGCGFVWWKGWRLPDMMFATRRSLSDACNTVGKQLENVYSSVSATKRHLSSRIDRVDCSLNEFADVTLETHKEVCKIRGEVDVIDVDFKNVHHAVRTLETKINRIEGKQAQSASGVCRLLKVASSLENALGDSGARECLQAGPSSSSKPAIEVSHVNSASRTRSLPLTLVSETSPQVASNGSQKVKPYIHGTVAPFGLNDLHGISDVLERPIEHVETNGNRAAEDVNNGNSSFGLLFEKLPSIGASFLSRTRSIVHSFK